MAEVSMMFIDEVRGISVSMHAAAVQKIEKEALKARDRETGGILIGSYDASGSSVIISEATSQTKDSASGRAWFERGVIGLTAILRRRWGFGLYYVGEWHSHPDGEPEPSASDFKAIREISKSRGYQCPKPVMIIAGTSRESGVNLSAHVFDGRGLIALKPHDVLGTASRAPRIATAIS